MSSKDLSTNSSREPMLKKQIFITHDMRLRKKEYLRYLLTPLILKSLLKQKMYYKHINLIQLICLN